ncbi:MAG: metabolite traffic protein EboE [Planctomycetes bacterium]|nr:metabolite traffic protein EboE [Planctomycetota bacterium]
MQLQVGYCTNVHAGADWPAARENLARHALAVKEAVRPKATMGVGLWLAAQAARQLLEDNRIVAARDWLEEVGLTPFTFNGFPYGDFHQPVVKHRVYQPTWWEEARLAYTLDLIEIQHVLLPPAMEGSISTLPIAWPEPKPNDEQLRKAAKQLSAVAERLARLEAEEGRLISLCLEPEPGCYLQRSEDIVRYFKDYLLPAGDEAIIRRHLRVCHDVCHAAVMFEDQADVLQRYREAGIEVGKVQVSAAIHVPLDRLDAAQRENALQQLTAFAEGRYLHQTVVGPEGEFFEDLPQALAAHGDSRGVHAPWRIHFHVPIYLVRFGALETTQDEIIRCLEAVRDYSRVSHFEVETYAWSVLPEELQQPQLADGIAEEIRWFDGALASIFLD